MTLRTKYFLLFVAIAGIPFLIFSSLVLYLNAREMEKAFTDTAIRSARQAALSLDALIEPANRALSILAASDELAALAQKPSSVYRNNLGAWYLDSTEIHRVMRTASGTTPMISEFFIMMKDGLAGFSESREYRLLSADAEDRWQKVMSLRHVDLQWFSPEYFPVPERREALSGVARIRDPENLQSTVGFARADIPLAVFGAVLENAELSANAFTLLSDAQGQAMTLSIRGKRPSPNSVIVLGSALASDTSVELSLDEDFGDGRLLVFSRRLAAPGWRFSLAVPYRDVMRSADRARSRSLLVFLCIIPILFPVAWFSARSTTSRIRSLRDRFALVGSGLPEIRREDASDDEIGQLSRRFNEMTLRIDGLLKEEYELGHRVSELELQVLQAQINPHFLYNTLDMVNCLALSKGDRETAQAVSSLARFYRASLSGGADMVSLSSELAHVQGYVEVENLRFEGGIRLEVDVPASLGPELDTILLPKMTLQPLVENAIHHGILEKSDESGVVIIRVRKDAGILEIDVLDDGVGLSGPEPSDEVQRPDHGFGLRNIRDRLTLAFGDGASLTISDRPEGGASASIRVPSPAS